MSAQDSAGLTGAGESWGGGAGDDTGVGAHGELRPGGDPRDLDVAEVDLDGDDGDVVDTDRDGDPGDPDVVDVDAAPIDDPEPSDGGDGDSRAQSSEAPAPVAPDPFEPTGEPRVDDAVARLGDLDESPTAEHVGVYEDVHRRLHEALSDLGAER